MSSLDQGTSDKVITLLSSRRGVPVIKQLVSNEITRAAVRQAFNCLTKTEQELVTMKVVLGLDSRDIVGSLGFTDRKDMHRRWKAVLALLRRFTRYFACHDHRAVLKEIESRTAKCTMRVCQDLLCGKSYQQAAHDRNCTYMHARQVVWLLQKTMYEHGDSDVRAFIDTLRAVRRFKRL